jgi:hypothetical protein
MPYHSLLWFSLMHYLVPLYEKLLVALVHIAEIANTHSFELQLQVSQIVFRILPGAVLPDFSEDVNRVEVLSSLFFILLNEFAEDGDEDIPDSILEVGAQDVILTVDDQELLWIELLRWFGFTFEVDGEQVLWKLVFFDFDLALTMLRNTLWTSSMWSTSNRKLS